MPERPPHITENDLTPATSSFGDSLEKAIRKSSQLSVGGSPKEKVEFGPAELAQARGVLESYQNAKRHEDLESGESDPIDTEDLKGQVRAQYESIKETLGEIRTVDNESGDTLTLNYENEFKGLIDAIDRYESGEGSEDELHERAASLQNQIEKIFDRHQELAAAHQDIHHEGEPIDDKEPAQLTYAPSPSRFETAQAKLNDGGVNVLPDGTEAIPLPDETVESDEKVDQTDGVETQGQALEPASQEAPLVTNAEGFPEDILNREDTKEPVASPEPTPAAVTVPDASPVSTEPAPVVSQEKTPWQEAREKYRSYRTEMLSAQDAYLKSIEAFEQQKKDSGRLSRLFSSGAISEKKKEMRAAEDKYNELIDRVRSERGQRMQAFIDAHSSMNPGKRERYETRKGFASGKNRLSPEELEKAAGDRAYNPEMLGLSHEALLDKHVDNAVALIENARTFGDSTRSESQYKLIRGFKKSYEWYRRQNIFLKIGIGTGVAAAGGFAAALTAGAGLLPAAGVGALRAQRRFIGGTIGMGAGIATKLSADRYADRREARKMEASHETFSEKSLSQARKERLGIKRTTRNIKRTGTVTAAGVGFAIGAGASDVVSTLAHNPDASLDWDWSAQNLKNIDPTKTIRGYVGNIEQVAGKVGEIAIASAPNVDVEDVAPKIDINEEFPTPAQSTTAPQSILAQTLEKPSAEQPPEVARALEGSGEQFDTKAVRTAIEDAQHKPIPLEGKYAQDSSITKEIDKWLAEKHKELTPTQRARVAYRIALDEMKEMRDNPKTESQWNIRGHDPNRIGVGDTFKAELDPDKVKAHIERVTHGTAGNAPVEVGKYSSVEHSAGKPHRWVESAPKVQDPKMAIGTIMNRLGNEFGFDTKFWAVMHGQNISELREMDYTELAAFAESKGVSVDVVHDMLGRIKSLSDSNHTPIGPLDTSESLVERAASVRAGRFLDTSMQKPKTVQWINEEPKQVSSQPQTTRGGSGRMPPLEMKEPVEQVSPPKGPYYPDEPARVMPTQNTQSFNNAQKMFLSQLSERDRIRAMQDMEMQRIRAMQQRYSHGMFNWDNRRGYMGPGVVPGNQGSGFGFWGPNRIPGYYDQNGNFRMNRIPGRNGLWM